MDQDIWLFQFDPHLVLHVFHENASRVGKVVRLCKLVLDGLEVLIDRVDEEGGATGRSKADAPEIDGEVHLRDAGGLKQGDIILARVEDSDEHDLFGVPA